LVQGREWGKLDANPTNKLGVMKYICNPSYLESGDQFKACPRGKS
jgi:hypothetical protein